MNNLIKMNRTHCILALVSCLIVVVCVCAGVTMNLTTLHDQNFDNMGIRTFRMFTVNSNILAAIAAAVVIPYTIDGLRKKDYHLPNWVVTFFLVGTTAVALTFLVSLFILSPVKGFVLIFTGSRFFLHGVCPILIILAFCIFITSHKVSWRESFFSLIPVAIYAILYFVMVVVITKENGGWDDFYGFATRLPLWIPIVAILPLTFGITALLRLWHNASYKNRKRKETECFMAEFGDKDANAIIYQMGASRAGVQPDGDIVVPARIIELVINYSKSDLDAAEGCRIYLDGYLGAARKGNK